MIPGIEAPRRRWLSAPAALPLGLLLLVLPLLLPEDAHLGRAVLTGYAVSLAMKLRLLVAGEADPEMLATLPRLLVWLVTPQATWWPRSNEQLVAVRRAAPGQLLRALTQAILMMVLVAAKIRFAVGERGLLLLTAVEMLEFFLLLAALAEGMAGLVALAGIHSEAVFSNPAAARSPRDFWSCRWNLVVHRFARRQIFLPVARRVGPVAALVLTFSASGLMHEYVVLASVGASAYRPGFMLGFFALQAVAVLATAAFGRRGRRWTMPRLIAATIHLGWLLATAQLFFLPLRVQITAFDDTTVRLADAMLSVGGRLLP